MLWDVNDFRIFIFLVLVIWEDSVNLTAFIHLLLILIKHFFNPRLSFNPPTPVIDKYIRKCGWRYHWRQFKFQYRSLIICKGMISRLVLIILVSVCSNLISLLCWWWCNVFCKDFVCKNIPDVESKRKTLVNRAG